MKNALLTLSLLAAAIAATNAPAASLVSLEPFTRVSASTDPVLVDALKNPAWRGVHAVRVDGALIDPDTHSLDIDLGNGVIAKALANHTQVNSDGSIIWSGTVLPGDSKFLPFQSINADGRPTYDPANHVLLVRNGDKITGNIRKDGREVHIRPLRHGGHLLAEFDATLQRQKLAEMDYIAEPSTLGHHHTLDVAADGHATVRVLVAFSAGAANRTGDAGGLANLAIATANRGFRNSGIDMSFELAGVAFTGMVDARDEHRDLDAIAANGWIAGVRNDWRADVVTYVSADSGGCGLAHLNSNQGNAFSHVDYWCFQGDNVFAHEVGHNLGAMHDPATTGGGGGAYPYGYGYQNYTIRQRTVMAYDCNGGCYWAEAWSSPHVYIGGHAMGNGWQSDNRRVLQERRFIVAGFR